MHKELLLVRFTHSSTDSRMYICKSSSTSINVVVVTEGLLTSCKLHSLLNDFKSEMQNVLLVKTLVEEISFVGLGTQKKKKELKGKSAE